VSEAAPDAGAGGRTEREGATAARRVLPGRVELLVVAGALAVRLLHLASIRNTPIFRYLLIDSAFYDEVGRRLATGGSFPEGVFFMNVLYGAFLGAVYTVFGAADGGRLAAGALQCVLGALSCGLIARIGAAIGRPRDGVIAAVLLAVFGPAVFYDAALLTPSLLLFLTTAATLAAVESLRRPSVAGALVLGLLLGLLILGRANHLLLLGGLALLLARRGRAGLGAAALATLTAIVVVSPVTVRNHRVSGELVPVTANGGMALWAGNHPGATGIYSQPGFLGNPVPEREAEDYRAEASRRAGSELTLAQSSGWWQRETLRHWGSEPARTARLLARKLHLWFHATESQTNLSYYFAQDQSPVLAVLRIHLGWILPFAICGLILDGRRYPALSLPIAVSVVTCLLFYVSSEYRHPVVPLLLLFAVFGGRVVVSVLREGETWRRAVVGLGLVLLLVAVNFRDPFLARLQSRRVDYLNFGTLAAEAGELDEAERLLRESIGIDPAWSVSRRKLAEVLQRRGQTGEAGEELRFAERLEGGGSAGAASLAQAGELFRTGRLPEAKRAFLSIAEAGDDRRAGALNNAGLCAMRLGVPAEAESLFLAARAADSLYVSPVVHLGRLSLAFGDSARAEVHALEALALEPADGRAQRLLERARGQEPDVEGAPDGDAEQPGNPERLGDAE